MVCNANGQSSWAGGLAIRGRRGRTVGLNRPGAILNLNLMNFHAVSEVTINLFGLNVFFFSFVI